MVYVTAAVIAALVLAIGAELLIPGHPSFCVPLASAPGWIVLAISVRVAVDGARVGGVAPGGAVPPPGSRRASST